MRATCAFFCLLTLLLAPRGAVKAQPLQRLAQHVIIISIDGLRPDYYLPLPTRQAKMPGIDALRARGSWADGVIGQFPSLTYPSHTSIATGARPAKHGVVQNTRFDPAGGGGTWFFESDTIKIPALWDGAKAAGLTTAGVS